MTAPVFSKMLASVEENLFNLGYSGKAKAKWFGDVLPAAGSTVLANTVPVAAAKMNFTDAADSTKDLMFIAVFRNDKVAGIAWPNAMTTKSHADGYFAQGSGYVELFMESPLLADVAHYKFVQDVIHTFRGQFGVRVELKMTANATVPTIKGVIDGSYAAISAAAEPAYTFVGALLPYGRVAAAGELA